MTSKSNTEMVKSDLKIAQESLTNAVSALNLAKTWLQIRSKNGIDTVAIDDIDTLVESLLTSLGTIDGIDAVVTSEQEAGEEAETPEG
jgi:hypothetical protein